MKQSGHGGDIYTALEQLDKQPEEIIDFSANINPFGMPPSVREALVESIEECIHYPDPYCRKLIEGIAAYHDVTQESVLCGNGAADLIFRLVYALRPKKGLVLAPTFSEYELALKSSGAQITYYDIDSDTFQVDRGILEAINETLDVVFICNPNNPTGTVMDKGLLIDVVEKCQKLDIICMIDECFNDFIVDGKIYSMVQYMSDYKNLIVLKAFTKMYALAGVRLGYALSVNTDLLNRMYEMGQCWSVSTLAQAAGCAALKEVNYAENTAVYVQKQRTWMIDALQQLGYKVYQSQVNYILFYSEHIHLHKSLYSLGILIRNCDNYRGLQEGYYRIAVKEESQNKKLIQEIERITKQWQNH